MKYKTKLKTIGQMAYLLGSLSIYGGFATSNSNNHIEKYSISSQQNNKNHLSLSNAYDVEKQLSNFKFNEYNTKSSYTFLISEKSKNLILRKIAEYIFINNNYVYRDPFLFLKGTFGVEEVCNLDILRSYTYKNNNFIFSFESLITHKKNVMFCVNDWNVYENIGLSYNANGYYNLYAKFNFDIYSTSWQGTTAINTEEPYSVKTLPYREKMYPYKRPYMNNKMKKYVTTKSSRFVFSNIKFYMTPTNMELKTNLNNFDIFTLNGNELLRNVTFLNAVTKKISYTTHEFNNLYSLLVIKNIEFSFNNKYQNILLSYNGNYEIPIKNNTFDLNFKNIISKYDIYSINEEILLKEFTATSKIYQNLINKFHITKDFFNNRVELLINTKPEAKNLIFYNLFKRYYVDRYYGFSFDNHHNITIKKDYIQSTYIEEFDLNKLKIAFENESEGTVEIKKLLNKYVDMQEEKIYLKLRVLIRSKNYSVEQDVDIILEGFLKFNTDELQKYINENFYDSKNKFMFDNFSTFIKNSSNWKDKCIISDGIQPRVTEIIRKDNNVFVYYDLINQQSKIIKSGKMEIIVKNQNDSTNDNNNNINNDDNNNNDDETNLDKESNKENANNVSNFKKEYLYLLILLVIPLIFIIFKIVKSLKKRKYKI